MSIKVTETQNGRGFVENISKVFGGFETKILAEGKEIDRTVLPVKNYRGVSVNGHHTYGLATVSDGEYAGMTVTFLPDDMPILETS